MAMDVEAQIKTILNDSLVDRFVSGVSELEEHPSVLSEWTFEKCYAWATDGKTYVQVGSSSQSGSVTTPDLTGLTGNARIKFAVHGIDDDVDVHIRRNGVGSLSYNTTNTMPDNTNWYSQPSIILRNANASTSISFYNNNGGERFEIRNIQICDIGDNIFYETFDGNTSSGGNDGSYDIDDSVLPELDNVPDSYSKLYSANKCVAFLGGGNYTTKKIPITNSGSAVLSFKVAGCDSPTDHYVNISTSGGASVSVTKVDATACEWETVEVTITGLGDNEKLIFYGFNVFLDEIRVREVASDDLSMSQTDGSNSYLDDMTIGTVANVTLTRTLTADIWNTLCLPFRFDTTMLTGENHLLRLTSVTDGCYNFTEDDAVPAGEPFLLQVSSTTDNPTFNNVTIRTTSPGTKMFGDYGLQGIFFTTDLETDNSNAFLGTDGSLYYPTAESNTMNGLRAYFVKPSAAPARISLSLSEPAAIHELPSTTVAREYNLWGQRVTSSCRGIVIRNGKKIYRH